MIWVDHASGRYHLTLGDSVRHLPRLGSGTGGRPVAAHRGDVRRVDGTLLHRRRQTASAPFTGNVGNSNTWRIGAYGRTANGFFDGSIDNVRIYDRALTASEIQRTWRPASSPTRGPDGDFF